MLQLEKNKIVLDEQQIYKGNLILINPDYLLKRTIRKEELESYNKSFQEVLLQKEANFYLQSAMDAIAAGNRIVPVSGFRTLADQEKIIADSTKENGIEFTKKYVALPNASEHQTGLAIDLGLNEGEIDFIRPSFPRIGICEKFRKISVKYGFIERYQEERKTITKISAEEWHFRYVGYPHSEIIRNNHFCLEEYIVYLREHKKITYKGYEIEYIPYLGKPIEIEIGKNIQISGNNVDGFIVTKVVA